MWDLTNLTPYRVLAVALRDGQGTEIVVVVVRGTFAIGRDGKTTIAEVQTEPTLLPIFRGDPQLSSLEYETDFVPAKPGTDVLLHGHAYAPQGQTRSYVDVSMRVGPIGKSLRVYGDRVLERGSRVSDPLPFARMPIIYERAYGGMFPDPNSPHGLDGDMRNPVGVGFGGKLATGSQKPNIEQAAGNSSRPEPAGFGPIARHWSPRRELAGTYDDHWRQTRMPLPPDDFQDAFYQCAPRDQQCPGHLEGGEEVELLNLSTAGVMRLSVPRVPLDVSATIGSSVVGARAQMHTVILMPDVANVTLVWHCAFACQNQGHKVRRIAVRQKSNVSGST
jgi:hypothetical protein